jgi:ribosome biogenesis protein ERB1
MRPGKEGPTKRKAPLSDAGAVSGSDDEFPELDGVLSQSSDGESDVDEAHDDASLDSDDDDGVVGNGEGSGEDDDHFDSTVSSDGSGDEAWPLSKTADGGGSAASLIRREAAPDDLDNGHDQPAYRVTTDAYGGVRYEYAEIDPVYDSDDSAREEANTIGNIPLSYYDTYPHIGYSVDGKKIMRPAAGAALDSLLDSIEVPKDWTGLTDPATGQPLKISQDERELLARIQMGEIPEAGYDPYPVSVAQNYAA